MKNTITIILVLTSFCAYLAVICRVYQFSFIITNPITLLTGHINDYKKAKGLEDKTKVIKHIELDTIFARTKMILDGVSK